jgi:8-oxo-dGTP pyrophosphatase MutT (NUDIX family)
VNLRREVREELGIGIASMSTLLFKDRILDKTFADGSKKDPNPLTRETLTSAGLMGRISEITA